VSAPARSATSPHPRAGPAFWLSAACGWAVIAYGVWGLVHHHLDTRPTNYAKFAVGGALIHDLLFAPVVLLAGVAIAHTVRGPARAPVQAALIVSGCVVLYAFPLIRGYGHAAHNPSSLPHNYTANVVLVLAGVWLVATATIVVRSVATRRSRTRG